MLFNKYFFLLFKSIIPVLLLLILNSCGIWNPGDARTTPTAADERVAQNIEEGRGMITGKNIFGSTGGTNFQFATSNPLWRAALSVLDFLPLANVDYAGGIIITDWYNEGTSNDESIKITVRFLTNEVRADAVSILIHKKICNKTVNCNIKKITSNTLEEEIKLAILKKASILEKEHLAKVRKSFKNKYGESLPEKNFKRKAPN